MRRRDFVKYISLMGAFCCGCSNCLNKDSKENKQANLLDKMINNKELEIVKFPICYHCNLNCAYCCHFSPIAPRYQVDVQIFRKDVEQLAKITKSKVRILSLMGGEPLLHKNIEELFVILNKYFPESKKRVTTNGLLLKDKKKDFFRSCKDNNIEIECSDYYLSRNPLNIEDLKRIGEEYQLRIKFNKEKIDKFELANLSREKTNLNNYQLCDKKYGCTQLDNGRIYPCSIASNIEIFNNYFKDYRIPVSKKDYLDIHTISSIEEIFEFFKKPKEICKYCALGHNRELKPWKISSLDVSEWYNIKD